MKLERAKEASTIPRTGNERSRLAWFKTGIWKLKEVSKESMKGRCPLYSRDEDAKLILKFSG
jgi:hypothetical protein